MAKGRKDLLRTKNTAVQKVDARTKTKENKPSSVQDCTGKVQSAVQTVLHLNKPKSPLSENSSLTIQEGTDTDARNPDIIKLRKEILSEKSESESQEQKTETACWSHGMRAQNSDQVDPTTQTDAKQASDSKVSTPKTGSKTSRKTGKKSDNKVSQNRKVTDFFPVRRSNRKTKSELKSEEHRHLDGIIKSGIEEGLRFVGSECFQVKQIEGKGRGVFALNGFQKGDFVVEYHGDLLELSEAKKREAQYAEDPKTGCYMYYFQYQTKTYCVDATKESGRLGRLVNHSKAGNCQTKLHPINGSPHLILVASRDIKADEELLYDYGDRSKASVLAHPWLKY